MLIDQAKAFCKDLNASLPYPVNKKENEDYRHAFDTINATSSFAIDSSHGVVEMKKDASWNPFPSENLVDIVCEQNLTRLVSLECESTDQTQNLTKVTVNCDQILSVKGMTYTNIFDGIYEIQKEKVNERPLYYNAAERKYLYKNNVTEKWYFDFITQIIPAQVIWSKSPSTCPTGQKYTNGRNTLTNDSVIMVSASKYSSKCDDILKVSGLVDIDGIYVKLNFTWDQKPVYHNNAKDVFLFYTDKSSKWWFNSELKLSSFLPNPKAWAFDNDCPTEQKYYKGYQSSYTPVNSISVKSRKGLSLKFHYSF